jgi:uncharacterized protein YjiS (DUF1127 family)
MQNLATALHPSLATNPTLGDLGAWRWLREQVSYFRSMSELNRLDDKTLDDIGVSRDQFSALARRHARGLPPIERAKLC